MKSIVSEFYKIAISELVAARVRLAWSQHDLAKKWNRNQSVIAKIEIFERRVDLIEYIDLCVILNIDPHATIAHIHDGIRRKRTGPG